MISIIIPTLNEEKHIAECLISIQNQNYNDYEIIVVDSGSKDETLNIIRKFRKVKLIETTILWSPGSLKNIAVKKSIGDIILFLDADEIIGEDYIRDLISPIIKGKYDATVPHHYTNGEKIRFRLGVFRAIKKNKFLELGGFNEQTGYCDDSISNFDDIKYVDVSLYHIISDSPSKFYFKGKWVGKSFEYNEKTSWKSKLLYKLGLFVGFFSKNEKS